MSNQPSQPVSSTSLEWDDRDAAEHTGAVITTRDDTVLIRTSRGWYNPRIGTTTDLHSFDFPVTLHHTD